MRLEYGGRTRHVYDAVLQGFATADLTEGEARVIAADPRVAFVEEDRILDWVLSWATSGVVSDPMGTPNLLLFSPFGN